jgi:uncharacterized protein YigE (DUF2233 family)
VQPPIESSIVIASTIRALLLAGIVALLLAACDVVGSTATAPAPPPPTRLVPTLFPTSAAPPSTGALAQPAATKPPDTGWMPGPSGVELRDLHVVESPERPPIPVTILRLDPAKVRLRVAYAPDRPLPLRAWFAAEQPIAVINGGFFLEDYRTAALLISDGAASGTSYAGFGGMLAVAPGGEVSIRPLRDQPYDPAEDLAQALQSFPMLVFPGGEAAEPEDNGERARRSAIALDRDGRLLLIACPTSGFTLRGLAEWLSRSDLGIDAALNLDGGSSTGLFARAGDLRAEIDSFGALPSVLLVESS